MEYDYAVEKGVPVLGFVRDNVGDIPFDNTEKSEKGRKKLEAFRNKVMSRTCRKYLTSSELRMAVMKSVMATGDRAETERQWCPARTSASCGGQHWPAR